MINSACGLGLCAIIYPYHLGVSMINSAGDLGLCAKYTHIIWTFL